MNDVTELALKTLEKGYLMSLATTDQEGVWVADVIYIHDDDLNLYWMSRTGRRHSRAIDGGYPEVAATITVSNKPTDTDQGLQISGTAARLENPPLDLLKDWMKKKKKPVTSAIGSVLTDHVWYTLTPERIELINRDHFRDRQTVR